MGFSGDQIPHISARHRRPEHCKGSLSAFLAGAGLFRERSRAASILVEGHSGPANSEAKNLTSESEEEGSLGSHRPFG